MLLPLFYDLGHPAARREASCQPAYRTLRLSADIFGSNLRSSRQLAAISSIESQYPTARPARYAAPMTVVSVTNRVGCTSCGRRARNTRPIPREQQGEVVVAQATKTFCISGPLQGRLTDPGTCLITRLASSRVYPRRHWRRSVCKKHTWCETCGTVGIFRQLRPLAQWCERARRRAWFRLWVV
jgi:hypothetical protein